MAFFDALSGFAKATNGATLTDLLRKMKKGNGTELRVMPGRAPEAVVKGSVLPLSESVLAAEECKNMCTSLFTDAQKAEFEKNKKIEFAFGIKDVGRLKAAIVSTEGKVRGVFTLLG